MLALLARHGFLALLLATLLAGMAWPAGLRPLAAKLPQDALVATVMLAMSLSLEAEALGGAMRRPKGAALASFINLGLLPPLGWLFGRALPPDLANGLIVAASVPCTVASAAVWTRRAGGNDAVAIVVTVVTNLLCFVVTPAWVELLAGRGDAFHKSFGELAGKLLLIVALPVAAGQLLRLVPRIAHAAHQRRQVLGYYSQLGILAMVLVGAVKCGERLHLLNADEPLAPLAGGIAAMAALAALLHFTAWWVGWRLSGMLGVEPADRSAVAFSGSQKTLMVGLTIAVQFGGLAVLPMVAYHVLQLVIDTLLADRLRRKKWQTMSKFAARNPV